MRAEEIKDADSLQAWLESLPQETEAQRETARRWAVTIAHRAAMRVLPVFWDWKSRRGVGRVVESDMLVFRGLLFVSTQKYLDEGSSLVLASDIRNEFSRANEAYLTAINHESIGAEAAMKARLSASMSVHVTEPQIGNIASAPLRTRGTVLMAADSATKTEIPHDGFYHQISVDCTELNREGVCNETAIWEIKNSFNKVWASIRPKILAQGEGWRFWVEWYENALYGRPQDYDLLTKIALIDPADWDKGADHVNALIAQIRLEHIAETRPLGEDAIDIGPDGLWHRTGKSDIDGDILQDAVKSVLDEIASLRTKLQGPQGNMLTALVSDLDLLDQRIARHPDRPLRLHDVFIRVQGHIARNLQSGELPDDDCVRDLSSVLGNAALDMCNACDKTKSVVQKRMAVRFDEADEQTRDDLKLIAEGAARISDADLASEFIEDAEVIADEAISLSEKTSTLYRLQTRLARIVSKDGKNLVDALCLIGAMGSGVGVLVWITTTLLRFIIGP